MKIAFDDIKVKIKLLNSKTILAQATIILFDVWEEHGWKILRSNRIHPQFQEELWIQAPSYRYKNNNNEMSWREIVYINDRELHDWVQEKIYDAFCMARNKMEGLKSIDKEDLNRDETINQDNKPNLL